MEENKYEPKTPRQVEIVWVQQKIAQLSAQRFFGKITIEMKEGRVVIVTEEKTSRPPQS